MRRIIIAGVARLAWTGLIAYAALRGVWNAVLFNAVLFLGSSFLLYLGMREPEYHILDALVCATFATALCVGLFFTWQTPGTLAFDKLFHALGGMCLAWFAAILYRPHLKARWEYALAIVTFALALGGAWEILEWTLSLAPAPYATAFNPAGLADSFGDMIADTAGGAIIAVIELRRQP